MHRTARSVLTEVCRFLLAGLLIAACFAAGARAQEVKVGNNSGAPFSGWVRTKVDHRPPRDVGQVDGATYVLGRRTGLDTWAVDLRMQLAAGERRTIDLAAAAPAPRPAVALPSDLMAHFGGWITVGGVPLGPVAVAVDGAAVTAHLAGRIAPMFFVDVWARWYPDEPGLIAGEAVVTCSNGSIPDMGGTIAADMRLAWGDGLVSVAGAGWGGPLVPAGTSFADGQARAVPFAVGWTRHIAVGGAAENRAWAQLGAAAGLSVTAIGVDRLWPDGNPQNQPGFDAVEWSKALFPTALRHLHTWEPGVVGPNPNSGDTGAQEDQVFVRGEPFAAGGVGAEQVAYLGALELFSRPCHHLEADGRQADPADHPQAVFWSGRPHWHHGVSPDQLGKVGALPDTHGWSGPDREHWLYNTVAAAARMIESPALQHELEQQARIFLFGETTKPGWSTSGPDAARSVGWASILAVHLWRNLEDRALAERVLVRWQDRARNVYLPVLGAKPLDIWDVRVDDDRLGDGAMWMAWQQSIGSYGLWLAAREFNMPVIRDLALRAARRCLASNWIKQGSRYHGVGNIQFPPPPDSAYEGKVWPEPWFETTWDLPAIWVVLQEDPADQKARAVWAQAIADLGAGRRSWVPPGEIPPPPASVSIAEAFAGAAAATAVPAMMRAAAAPPAEQTLTMGECSLTIAGHLGAVQTPDGGWIVQVPDAGAAIVAYSGGPGGGGCVVNWPGNLNSDYGGPPPTSLQLTLPRPVVPEDAAIVASGAQTPGARGAYPYAFGGRSVCDQAMPVVFVRWPATAGVLRPPAFGAGWLARFFRSMPVAEDALHFERLPSVIDMDALPVDWSAWGAGKTSIDYALALTRPFCGEFFGGWSTDGFTPDQQWPGYGREVASVQSIASLWLCSTAPPAVKRALAIAEAQIGFDLVGAFADGRRMINGGGHAAGRKAPVIWFGHMLGVDLIADPTAVLGPVFQEDQAWFAAPAVQSAWFFEGWRNGWRFKPENEGPLMSGALLRQSPATWGDFEAAGHNTWGWAVNGYLEHSCGAQVGTALAMRLIGRTREWSAAADGMIAQFMAGPPAAARDALTAAGCRVVWGRDWHPGRGAGTQAAAWRVYVDGHTGASGGGAMARAEPSNEDTAVAAVRSLMLLPLLDEAIDIAESWSGRARTRGGR